MNLLTEFSTRNDLNIELAKSVSQILSDAIKSKGKASLAVSGGSTPKGFFNVLSKIDIEWSKVTITLADERWVAIDSQDSNTLFVYENLLQNNAAAAKFFHLKQGDEFSEEMLNSLNIAVKTILLPLDVVILGMGEDGHAASLFPCSDQIRQGLEGSDDLALLKVIPKTAPHKRISFSFAALSKSAHTFLLLYGENKRVILNQALVAKDVYEMPIRAFLHHPTLQTQIYWAS